MVGYKTQNTEIFYKEDNESKRIRTNYTMD